MGGPERAALFPTHLNIAPVGAVEYGNRLFGRRLLDGSLDGRAGHEARLCRGAL